MSRTSCKKPHQKILFLAEVMNFWKSRFACNYIARVNFNIEYLKTTFEWMTFPNYLLIWLETLGICSRDQYLKILCMNFFFIASFGFYEFLRIPGEGQNDKKSGFRAIKWEISDKKEIHTQNIWALTHRTYPESLKRFRWKMWKSRWFKGQNSTFWVNRDFRFRLFSGS